MPFARSTTAASAVALVLLAGDARGQGWEPEAQPSSTAAPEMRESTPVPAGGSPVDVELAGELTYVTAPIRGGTNPFGAGFGARAGLVYSGFYVGVSVLDFVGGKDVDVSYRSLLYGLDVGYGLRLRLSSGSSFTFRPRVGVGDAAVYYTDPRLAADVVTSASGSRAASDTLTVNNLFVRPGVSVLFVSGPCLAALDGSVLVLPGIAYGGADPTTWVSYGAQLELGFRF